MYISSTIGIVPVSGPAHSPATPEQRTLIQAVKAIDPAPLFGQGHELTFMLDRTTKRMLVCIVDRQTGEIVNQFPLEYVLRLAEESKGR